MSGKFIVLEGLEGAGKSTAMAVIENWLKNQGIPDVITTREPGGTPIAEELRRIVKTPSGETINYENKGNLNLKNLEILSPISELLLMYASRVQLVTNVIQPALQKNTWVIGDRHELSTRAYQGGGRGIPQATLEMLHILCLQNFKPDLTIYLDLSPSIGFERIKVRGYKDRIEQEELSFFERVREAYLSYIDEKNNIFLVDASQPIEQVNQDIIEILDENLLNKRINSSS